MTIVRTTSISLDDLTDQLLESITKTTGMTQTEVIRRLIISFKAGRDASALISDSKIDKKAVEAWKWMSE